MDLRREYDQYVEHYREEQNRQLRLSGETGSFFAEYKVEKLVEWLPGLKELPIMVLDYGCGDGLMTSYIRKHFPKAMVYGVDSSEKSIAYAKSRHGEGIDFRYLDTKAIPFVDQSMDLVFASGVIHHIPPREHAEYFQEIIRVVKPGGWFVLFELNPLNPFSLYVFRTSPFDRNATLLFPRYAKHLLANYGRVVVKYYAFFPAFLKSFRPLESYLTSFPLGALYAAILRRSEVSPA